MPLTPTSSGHDLDEVRTRQALAEPQPEFLSIVPYTDERKEPRLRLKSMAPEVRKQSYIEYETPYTQQEAMSESGRCLQCTCEAIGFCDLAAGHRVRHHPADPRAGAYRLSFRSVTENRFTGHNHDYIARQPRLHLARAVALHRLRSLRQRVQGGRWRGLLRLHAHRLRHARGHAPGHEPQHHAVRQLRALRRDVPTGALMPQTAGPGAQPWTRAAASCAASVFHACPYDAKLAPRA